VYAILEETSEEIDDDNNPVINLLNLRRGAKYRAEGETVATVAPRETFRVSVAEWETIKAAVN
jgi:hypothetical protein